MKLETILPYAKLGFAVLAGVVGGSGATMAYKSKPAEQKQIVLEFKPNIKIEKPDPIKVELVCPRQ